ncbi:MAG: ABC transporter ATP-binding protein [Caldilineaceae bacterium]|nr:ABC transporter ATP-binding protein [Caldilineaceae bacterium]
MTLGQQVSARAATNAKIEADDTILEIRDLKTYFFLERGVVKAVDGVDVAVGRKKTLGVVGESGCGKSVTFRSVMRLIQSPPGKIVEGEILLHREDGATVDIVKLDPRSRQLRDIRGAEVAMIFQEPMTSLNPLHPVGRQISESVLLHQTMSRRAAMERAEEMLNRVHIADPDRRVSEYPHQLSGGMRQRVMIALALSCNPSILIADEPTTALDVTVQAQILDLMRELQDDFDSAIVLITHNLGVVSQMADHVAVMYMGRVVEYAPVYNIFHRPKHPYTIGLLNSVPVLGRKEDNRLVPITGMVPSPMDEIRGCAFADRCPDAMEICWEQSPAFKEHEPGHSAACWLHD